MKKTETDGKPAEFILNFSCFGLHKRRTYTPEASMVVSGGRSEEEEEFILVFVFK